MERVTVDITKNILLSEWHKSPLWASWATRLDDSHTYYLLPEEYNVLVDATGLRPRHFVWNCGDTRLVILGNADPSSVRHGILYTSDLPCSNTLVKWASIVHNERCDFSRQAKWDIAFLSQWNQLVKHRRLVRHIGSQMDIDMAAIDIRKTTLVQYALAYLYHWPDSTKSAQIRELALRVVKELYSTKEDHCPEFPGVIDAKKLVVDRIATHLEKDKENDGARGWNIAPYIPMCCADDFKWIRREFGHLDMYYVQQTLIVRPLVCWCFEPRTL